MFAEIFCKDKKVNGVGEYKQKNTISQQLVACLDKPNVILKRKRLKSVDNKRLRCDSTWIETNCFLVSSISFEGFGIKPGNNDYLWLNLFVGTWSTIVFHGRNQNVNFHL